MLSPGLRRWGRISPRLVGWALLLVACFNETGLAQTLTDRLLAEDPAVLAAEARSDGNIIRGAILFHRGNLNCVKCHRPTAEQERFGPDLSRLESTTSDFHLIESILQPSRVIKQGYETTIIAAVDGRLLSGLILEQNDQQLVIRDSQNLDQPIRLQRDEIESIRQGTISSMPEKLADELQDRQQFLDLLRYVIDIKERGPQPELSTSLGQQRELTSQQRGWVLVQRLNCAACHDSSIVRESLPEIGRAKLAPRLNWSAATLNPDWIRDFIQNPHATKPGTTMPAVIAGEPRDQQHAAQALTSFLIASANNHYAPEAIDATAVPRGFELFNSIGCAACHAPRDSRANEIPVAGSEPLGSLTAKYNVSALADLLENPLMVRPSGHMPFLKLTHREALDIAHFLLQAGSTPAGDWVPNPNLVATGKQIFQMNRCQQCHEFVLNDLAELKPVRRIATLKELTQGCLSETAGEWPDFQLNNQDREDIREALRHLPQKTQPSELTREQRLEIRLQLLNCYACHDRNQMGGVSPDRNPHFQTTNLNLGDQGRIPPTLSGTGAKLKEKWMREVLVTGRSARPYMKTRMPQFGEENIGDLIAMFQSLDHLSESAFAEVDNGDEWRKQGLELAGTKGLNCVSCHTYKYQPTDTMPAVDLTEMAERLERDWFYQYMLAPQKFSPHTVMPTFWPGGQAVRRDLAGTPTDQIDALWQYLLDGRQANAPHGVVREPLEIVVTDEAQMLRRSYPGIGKRGIGVGYPGAVNLAFDVEQMRLHAIWHGKFVDPAGVWTGQGSGNARPLGQVIEFPQGPNLDDLMEPWQVDNGRPPRHQFRGYVLDEAQRPTFRYTMDSVEVEDYFIEMRQGENQNSHLRRVVTFQSEKDVGPLRFRLAAGGSINSAEDGWFHCSDRLRVRILSDLAKVIDANSNAEQQLELHLHLEAGQPMEIVIEYQWD